MTEWRVCDYRGEEIFAIEGKVWCNEKREGYRKRRI